MRRPLTLLLECLANCCSCCLNYDLFDFYDCCDYKPQFFSYHFHGNHLIIKIIVQTVYTFY
jgi:hypothetical protein